jgi:hypothetical protein
MKNTFSFISLSKKLFVLLFLICGFLCSASAEVIILNTGDTPVTCQYGANPVLPDQIFSIDNYKTLFVKYEANGLLSCDGYAPFYLVEHDDISIFLDGQKHVITSYDKSLYYSTYCKSTEKNCMMTYIINTYYNDEICYGINSNDGKTFIEFVEPYHYTAYAHPQADVVNCFNISDNAGFKFPDTNVMYLTFNADSLWLLPLRLQ